jgi:hypothetical protein
MPCEIAPVAERDAEIVPARRCRARRRDHRGRGLAGASPSDIAKALAS